MPGRPRYAYLGPAGTFTEVALRQVASPQEAVYLPQPDVVSAIEAVRSGDADHAVVAIESTVEGGVTATLDALAVGSPLVLQREVLVQVGFSLVARPGTSLADVRRVAAHPHAWVQCRRWLAAHLPGVVHVPATSNTAPAALLAQAGDGDALGFDAALVPPAAPRTTGCPCSRTASRTTRTPRRGSWSSARPVRCRRRPARTRRPSSCTCRPTRPARC